VKAESIHFLWITFSIIGVQQQQQNVKKKKKQLW